MALTAVGLVVELIGLVMAGLGLHETWSANADEGQSLWDGPRRWLASARDRLLRRPRHVTVHLGQAVDLSAKASATGLVSKALRTDMPLPDQLAQLKEEVDEARLAAHLAQLRADKVGGALRQTTLDLSGDITSVRDELRRTVRRVALDGFHLAYFGLIVAGAGTLLQLLGLWLA